MPKLAPHRDDRVNDYSCCNLKEKEYRDNVRKKRSQQGESKGHMDVEPDVHHRLVAHVAAYLLEQRGLLVEQNPDSATGILQFGRSFGLGGVEASDRGRGRAVRIAAGDLAPDRTAERRPLDG